MIDIFRIPLCIFFLALAFASGNARALELTVALSVHNPAQLHADKSADDYAGASLVALNAELAREICLRINARCTVVNLPVNEILNEVEAARIDLGFANYLRTPERERRVAFSDPLWRSSSRLLATPQTSQAFAARLGQAVILDNLRDARVAVIEGSQQQHYLEGLAEERKLSLLAVPTSFDAVTALRAGQVDFALLPVVYAYALLRADATLPALEFVGPALTAHGLGGSSHIVLPRQKTGLRREVNQALGAMRADGTFQRIVRKHLPLGLD